MNKTITVPLEVKTLGKREFEGYASTFGNVDYGGDVVVKGAFQQTLADHAQKQQWPMMFWMHKPDQIPGKWLHMEEDSTGLYVKGKTVDTQLGNETYTLLKENAIREMSIGYTPVESDYTNDGIRLLKAVDLWETSIVSIAMNPLAQIENVKTRTTAQGIYVPTDDELTTLKRDVEQFLKKKGFSSKLAKTYVSNLFRESDVMPEDRSAMLDNNNSDDQGNPSVETPEEVEARMGLQSIKDAQEAFEINKILQKYWR